jgi:hypothetical protein
LFSNGAFLYSQGRPLYNWTAKSIDLVKTTILDKYLIRTCARWTEENLGWSGVWGWRRTSPAAGMWFVHIARQLTEAQIWLETNGGHSAATSRVLKTSDWENRAIHINKCYYDKAFSFASSCPAVQQSLTVSLF